MKIFNDAKTYRIKEVTETKSLKIFLLAINSIDLKFNSIHTTDFLNTVYSTTTIEQIFTLIQKFKYIIRMKKENKSNFQSHFAFFVDKNSISTFFSSSNSRSKKKKTFIFSRKINRIISMQI